jgi:L-alanine-DL-glutamate epimerase-like enolase superfamily enzyme
MKIKDIKVSKENLELTRPYSIAYKSVDSVDNCVLEIVAENGMYGLGSANPSKYVVGEDVDDTFNTLQQQDFDWLIGRDIREMNQLTYEVYQRFPDKPGAASTLDIALYDLFAKYLGVPLVKFLGQKHTSMPTSITIGIKGVEETLEEAREYVGRGFKHLKVKMGRSLEEDLARLKKLKEAFKNEVLIRVDANQGYTKMQLEDFYYNTLSMDVEPIEQPLPADAVDEYKRLPNVVKKLVALDETLKTPHDAMVLASRPTAGGIFNIKLMKCGGISCARQIAAIADGADIELMWGCNDESIISISAALHAAFSAPNTRYIDLDGSFDLARDVAKGGFVLKDGVMSLTDKPGLGVEKL